MPTHSGILNVDWKLLNSKSTHHLPATTVPPCISYNMFSKIDKVCDSVFALTRSSSRSSTTGSKTFVLPKKDQWTTITVMLVVMPLMLLSFPHFVSLMMLM